MMGGSTKANLKRPCLPSGWSIKKLRELCSQIQDGTHFTPQYVEYGIPFYSVESVTARNFSVSKYVTQEAHDVMAKRCRPQRGDILMTRIGSLGDTALVDWDHEASIYVSLALLRPGKTIDDAYLYAYTRSKAFIGEVESRSLPNAIPKKINLGDIGNVEIWVPDTVQEQKAIAAALSDADGVVAGLERVIAKKRLIKQGAMQDLLTARRRLPGFSGEWKESRLSEYGKTYGGLVGKSKQDFGVGSASYIEFLDIINRIAISDGEFPKVRLLEGERQNRVLCNDLLFNGSSETPEEVGLCAAVVTDLGNTYLNSFCFGYRITVSDRIDPMFMAALIRSGEGRERIKHLAQGATRYNLSKRALLQLQLRLPEYDEQKAIAAVLSDMDAEIQILESRLAKARAVKEGMMQNLLTGRVRLV